MLFKILKDGKSCHGGDMQWSLPTRGPDGTWTPGEWHEIDGKLSLCSRGFHVTDQPAEWWLDGCTVYVVEVEGELIHGDNKSVCRKVRLLAEATAEELASHRVYITGTHECKGGKWLASGNATVRAWDNATVEASGKATVRAWDNATVEASGKATVRAWDNATVRASGNATVEASGNATVEAWDNATVEAWGKATVRAWDDATVEASGKATVEAWGNATVNKFGSAKVTPSGYAVLINRTQNPPKIICGWEQQEAAK